jgi:hypothetical protein
MSRGLVEPGGIFDAIRENEGRIPSLVDVETFRPIAEKIGIPSELTEQARLRVCYAAFVYQFVRDNEGSTEDGSSFRNVTMELSSLLSATQTLVSRLDVLSSEARNAIEWAEEIVAYEMLGSSPTSSFGHSFFRRLDQEGSETTTHLHFPQILEAVSVLRNMLVHIRGSVRPADIGGRPFRTQATWNFIVTLREFWTKQLKRPFTFDQRMREPASEAAFFCWELLKLTDRNAKWPEFCTAMREAVRLDHPGRGRRRKSQKPLS